MKKLFPLLLLIIIAVTLETVIAQTITETELFKLDYKGNADVYSFVKDKATETYCYVYRVEDENKSFIISNNSLSEKYDYIVNDRIIFDSKGSYYASAGNYGLDYGIDNYFLIVNGVTVKNYDFIDSYTSYINKIGEFVFIFKEKGFFHIGYYSADNPFRQSDPYENIKAAYKYVNYQYDGEEGSRNFNDDYYLNENGERAFIAIVNDKTKIIFESGEIATNYSDINETSLMKNNNGELSYIAKLGGRFYERVGNEFVVSGTQEYDKFEMVSVPLQFNVMNEPVYSAGDSVSESKYDYFLVLGNKKLPAYLTSDKSKRPPQFGYGLTDIKLIGENGLSYFGSSEVIIPAVKIKPGEEAYDQYFSNTYFVKDGMAYELGYNTHPVKYSDKGDMLYSGIADLKKKDCLLMMNYGESRLILSRKKFDDVYDYGFAPNKEIYYVGQNYGDFEKNIPNESFLFLGDKLLGKYEYVSYQDEGINSGVLKFDALGNYAFVADEKIDSITYSSNVYVNGKRLPFPGSEISGTSTFGFISWLMYSKNNVLFYIGDVYSDPVTYISKKEVYAGNKSLGKIYNVISNFIYDPVKNEINFTASNEKKIYSVSVQF
ncbi:MAG: hypothetical protein ABI528_03620 [bacterium]